MKNHLVGKLFFFTVCLIFVVMVSGCKKKNSGQHVYISEAFKSWTYFNKGSYWVYKNDSTLAIDSVFLSGNPQILEVPINDYDGSTIEVIGMPYSSSLINFCHMDINLSGNESYQITLNNDGSFNPWGLLAYNSDNFILVSTPNGYRTLSVDSVYYIGQTKFYNVVHTQCTDNSSTKIYNFWFAKDIGLIKLVGANTNPSFSWSVLRYHVVQ